MFSLDTEARHGGVGKAGTVRKLLDTTDVTHWLLPLPQCRGWDLHFVLLIWGGKTQRLTRMETYMFRYSGCSQIDGRFVLPRKVVEMYSDTWFPERLISDKWDSSLFNILLN